MDSSFGAAVDYSCHTHKVGSLNPVGCRAYLTKSSASRVVACGFPFNGVAGWNSYVEDYLRIDLLTGKSKFKSEGNAPLVPYHQSVFK